MSYPNDQNEHIQMINQDTYPGKVSAFSTFGSYPLFYVTADGGVLCPGCVQEDLADTQCNGEHATCDPENPQWFVVACDANWEDSSLYCDHCSDRIESAYAEDEGDN